MALDLFSAYLSGAATQFFPDHFADPIARRRAVQRAASPIRPEVATVLAAQNAALASSSARDAHIDALRHGAAAVVTGQQVGLFLGPLFTIYKAASAIRVARALSEDSGRPVVPIFWLQTEDHDLPEIATCHVPTQQGFRALRHPAAARERISIAHRVLDPHVSTCCSELEDAIAHLPHAAVHVERLRRHYRPGASWAQAFAGVLAELFAAEGLILLDPRDPALVALAAPVHQQAVVHAESIATALAERGEALVAAGFQLAVHVRPGAPLSFFHPDGAAGPRYRLDPAVDGYCEVGAAGKHDQTTLLDRLASDPSSFSTSALLRPILQDYLLPTAAYVGGPGEIAYFAQMAPLYTAYGLPMPLIVPRARFRIIEPRTRRLLDQLHVAAADLQRPEDDLLAAIQGADARLDGAALARQLLAPFETSLEDARAHIEAGGPGLEAAVAKTRATVEKAVTKLTAKYESALLHRAHGVVDALREAKMRLYPNGIPQERYYGIASFAARWGEQALIEHVIDAIVPFDASVRDLEWQVADGATAEPAVETGR